MPELAPPATYSGTAPLSGADESLSSATKEPPLPPHAFPPTTEYSPTATATTWPARSVAFPVTTYEGRDP